MAKTRQEKLKGMQYTMTYSNYRTENVNGLKWGDAIWELFNTKNMGYRDVYQLDVLQAGKNDYGFYENFIRLTVPVEDQQIWDDYLWRLGYGFKKDEVTLLRILVEWDEGIDEVVAEFDY